MFILCFYNRFQIQCSTAPIITSKATIICNTAPTSPKSFPNYVGAFRLWWLEIPVINFIYKKRIPMWHPLFCMYERISLSDVVLLLLLSLELFAEQSRHRDPVCYSHKAICTLQEFLQASYRGCVLPE